MNNLTIKRNVWPTWLKWLRQILFSFPPVRRMVLRHHATQLREVSGLVIQEVSLPYRAEDLLDSVSGAVPPESSEESANIVVERISKGVKP
jgi:hypothetical protein